MKIFTTALLVMFVQAFGFAQLSFKAAESDTVQVPMTEFQGVTYMELTSMDSASLRWVRTDLDLSQGVTSAVCDNVVCHEPTTDSANFFMDSASSFDMRCYFYPNNSCGFGNATIKIYKPSDLSIAPAYTVFHGRIWCTSTGITTLQANELSINPNPAKNFIDVNFGSEQMKQISIVDILGNVVYRTESSRVSTRISIDHLNNGIYFLTVKAGNTQLNKRFIKS